MTYLEHVETDIAALCEFRTHPILAALQADILDRYIARYRAPVIKLRAVGY
jgi:hypothetical protein